MLETVMPLEDTGVCDQDGARIYRVGEHTVRILSVVTAEDVVPNPDATSVCAALPPAEFERVSKIIRASQWITGSPFDPI